MKSESHWISPFVHVSETLAGVLSAPVAYILPSTVRSDPTVAFFETPRPPAASSAPVVLVVDSVVFVVEMAPAAVTVLEAVTAPVRVDAPATVSVVPMLSFLLTPSPPAERKAPVVLEEASVVSVVDTAPAAVTAPPTLAFFDTPKPPAVSNEPVVLVVASVVVDVFKTPATVVVPVTATVELPSIVTPPEAVISKLPDDAVISTAGAETDIFNSSTVARVFPAESLISTSPLVPVDDAPG